MEGLARLSKEFVDRLTGYAERRSQTKIVAFDIRSL
jgi:hypothetical protein